MIPGMTARTVNIPTTFRTVALASAVLLAGCAAGPRTSVVPPGSEMPGRAGGYTIVEGRGPEMVAELRAAPPTEPQAVDGKGFEADQKRLAAQGFMHIGTAHFAAGDTGARADALEQGRSVGADQVIFYAPAAASDSLTVAYYVRFKLPFGATFRDLNATEKQAMSGGGVRIGTVVDNTPASKANLLAGDFIVSLDGKPVANRGEFQSMLRAKAGRAVTLGIVRNGETLDRMVRLGVTPGATSH